MSKIRIGMIGAGRMAQIHVEHLTNMAKDVEIAAVYSFTKEHADAMGEAWGTTAYTDYEQMLGEVELDAAYICTPTFTHAKIGLACAEHGLHMFMEKPIDLDLSVGQQLVDAVEERDLIAMTAFHWRYTRAFALAREWIGDDPIALVALRWYWSRPPIQWMWDKSQAGGQFVDQNIHLIDLSRGLAGEIETVYARYNRRQVNFEEEFDNWDGYAATFTYAGGAVGTCSGTYALFPEIQLGPVADFSLRDRLIRVTPEGVASYTADGITQRANIDPFHLGANLAFVDALRSGDYSAIRTSLASGLRSTAVALAANHSAETGAVVDLATYIHNQTTIGN